MKEAINKILKYVITFIAMLAVFSLCMIITYALPNGKIRGHIEESIELATGTGVNPLFRNYVPGARLDEYTDMLILNIALNKGTYENQSVLQRAFENSRYSKDEVQAISLRESTGDPNLYNNSEYSRYWHGIQVIVRPLLMIINYEEMRYLFYLIMAFILAWSSYLIYRNVSIYNAVAYILSLTAICIFMVPSSIQYMGIFTVSIAGVIAVNILYMKGKENLYPYFFIILGGCAAFFDLLTTPIISIGLPLLTMVMIETKKGEKAGKIFNNVILYSIIWAVSYGGVFVSKWLIASIVLHKDAITPAIEQLFFRFNGSAEHPTNRKLAVINNYNYLANNKVFASLYVAAIIAWIIAFIKKGKKIKDIFKYVLVYLFIALYPYVWYFILAGHSIIHGWFTHRAQVVTILAIFTALIYCIDIPKVKEISEGEIWKK